MEEKPVIDRKPTTSQWAQLCYKSLKDHLAPKGFSQIKAGVFKGKVKANIDFLEDKQVEIAGKIASGCLNHYRNRLKDAYKVKLDEKEKTLKTLSWHDLMPSIRIKAEISAYKEVLEELDYLTIK
jgi:hypothetical protein